MVDLLIYFSGFLTLLLICICLMLEQDYITIKDICIALLISCLSWLALILGAILGIVWCMEQITSGNLGRIKIWQKKPKKQWVK